MFLSSVPSTSWTTIAIIAAVTVIAEILVLAYLLPWFEKKSDQAEKKQRLEKGGSDGG